MHASHLVRIEGKDRNDGAEVTAEWSNGEIRTFRSPQHLTFFVIRQLWKLNEREATEGDVLALLGDGACVDED